jgi:hypothetical protein
MYTVVMCHAAIRANPAARESFTPTSILHAITAHAAHLAGCPASRARLLHVLLLCAKLTALPIARARVPYARLAARACLLYARRATPSVCLATTSRPSCPTPNRSSHRRHRLVRNSNRFTIRSCITKE